MRLTLELYIPEPVSNDVDELSELVTEAINKAIGESDFTVQDIGLSFQIEDL